MEQKNNNYVSMKVFGMWVSAIIVISMAVWGVLFTMINSNAQQIRENQMAIGKMEVQLSNIANGIIRIESLIEKHIEN